MTHYPSLLPVFVIGLLLFLPSHHSRAFYEWQDGDSKGEVLGLVRIYGLAVNNPEDSVFYTKKQASGIGEASRLIIQGNTTPAWGYDINLVQTYLPSSVLTSSTTAKTIERSAALNKQFSNEDTLLLDIDRLNMHWSQGDLDFTFGRQAINLATTFYFTPNDFFGPFAASTFYRIYKPGVDAARLEKRLGDLSQLSFIGVLGYETNTASDTGWSDNPDSYRTSYLARYSTVYRNFEWIALGGRVREDNILGGAITGELFNWLGIRAEGHIARARDELTDSRVELSLGLEHRWKNSLDARIEFFYHGLGAGSTDGYAAVRLQGDTIYLARRYSALGLNYQFTPLLTGGVVLLTNHTDNSQLWSLNAVYSLADESELVFNLNIPSGDKPVGTQIRSEFGLYPESVNIELRTYF